MPSLNIVYPCVARRSKKPERKKTRQCKPHSTQKAFPDVITPNTMISIPVLLIPVDIDIRLLFLLGGNVLLGVATIGEVARVSGPLVRLLESRLGLLGLATLVDLGPTTLAHGRLLGGWGELPLLGVVAGGADGLPTLCVSIGGRRAGAVGNRSVLIGDDPGIAVEAAAMSPLAEFLIGIVVVEIFGLQIDPWYQQTQKLQGRERVEKPSQPRSNHPRSLPRSHCRHTRRRDQSRGARPCT